MERQDELNQLFITHLLPDILQLQDLHTVPSIINENTKPLEAALIIEFENPDIPYIPIIENVAEAFLEIILEQLLRTHMESDVNGNIILMSLSYYHTKWIYKNDTEEMLFSGPHNRIMKIIRDKKINDIIIISPLIPDGEPYRSSAETVEFFLYHLPKVERVPHTKDENPSYKFSMKMYINKQTQ